MSLGTFGLVHWTVPGPILWPWNQLECFARAHTFKFTLSFKKEWLYPDDLVRTAPDNLKLSLGAAWESVSCPWFKTMLITFQLLCSKEATIMYRDGGTVECMSLDVPSKSWMPLKMQVSPRIPTCESCWSVHAHTNAVVCVWKSNCVYAEVYTYFLVWLFPQRRHRTWQKHLGFARRSLLSPSWVVSRQCQGAGRGAEVGCLHC